MLKWLVALAGIVAFAALTVVGSPPDRLHVLDLSESNSVAKSR
jgi:hypothetical protein